jgi:hypothetical protein
LASEAFSEIVDEKKRRKRERARKQETTKIVQAVKKS